MANNENKPLSPDVITADREALVALKNLPDYAPSNPELRVEAIVAIDDELRRVEEAEIVQSNVMDDLRASRVALRRRLHDAMLGSKAMVKAQYGPNSNAVQALGLKKKNDYRRRTSSGTK